MKENDEFNYDATDLDNIHAAAKREIPHVQPGREPAPMWVFVASMVAMVLGGGYAGGFVGDFSFEKNSPFEGKPVDVRPIVLSEDEGMDAFQIAMKKGQSVYNNCSGCHQATGLGQPGAIPPLAGSEWVSGGTERVARVVLHGLIGPVKVKGNNYNSAMTPFSQLNDKELSYVLTYIRNSWGNEGTMVTPEMVKQVRDATASHTGQWTEAALAEFADKNIPGDIPAGPGATAAPAPAAQ